MSALATAGRRLRRRGLRTRVLPRWIRLFVLAGVLAAVLVGLGGWFLVRDSFLVSVDHVTVTGAEGSEAWAITGALESAARKMTTLDFQTSRLRAAVARFPEVKGLRVTTRFPHGVLIHVIELQPVAVVRAPGREVVVAGDGTLLPRTPVSGSLPLITLTAPPIGGTVPEGWARAAAALLAAAPRRLLAKIAEVTTVAGHGLVAQIRNGPSIYFGTVDQAAAKWVATVAVLADPGSAGASYIDVTDPSRPVAGTNAGVTGSSTTSTTATSAPSTPAAAPAATGTSTTPTGG